MQLSLDKMPANLSVQARTLWQVADTVGTLQALASLFRSTSYDVQLWLYGHAVIPRTAFLAAVDYLVKELAVHEKKSQRGAGATKRILIVDDNVDAAVSFAVLLGANGHDVFVAHDGTSALSLAYAHRPHIVFLDLIMPGMNGFETARALRREPSFTSMKIVVLTGGYAADEPEQARAAGVDMYLHKPVDLSVVASLVGKFVS
jgi:CheY-like chemotaxis protein